MLFRELNVVFSFICLSHFLDKNSDCLLSSRLLKILCNSLAMLRHCTPDICGILFDLVSVASYKIVENLRQCVAEITVN